MLQNASPSREKMGNDSVVGEGWSLEITGRCRSNCRGGGEESLRLSVFFHERQWDHQVVMDDFGVMRSHFQLHNVKFT
jgi:hypothetical protein